MLIPLPDAFPERRLDYSESGVNRCEFSLSYSMVTTTLLEKVRLTKL
jgi:hypothetical protein